MNTTVITVNPHDFGAGMSTRVEFVDCRYKVDDTGWLHIYQNVRHTTGPQNLPVATFAPGTVAAAVNGSISGDTVRVAAVKR